MLNDAFTMAVVGLITRVHLASFVVIDDLSERKHNTISVGELMEALLSALLAVYGHGREQRHKEHTLQVHVPSFCALK